MTHCTLQMSCPGFSVSSSLMTSRKSSEEGRSVQDGKGSKRAMGTLGTGRYERVEGDDIGAAIVLSALLKEFQGQLPVPSLLAGTDQAAVRDHTPLAALYSQL